MKKRKNKNTEMIRFEEMAMVMQFISFDIHMGLMGEGASHTEIKEVFNDLRELYKHNYGATRNIKTKKS